MNLNQLKVRLDSGKPCVNGWLLLPSTFTAEAMAQAGWDSLTIDMQHGLLDYITAVQIIQAIQAHPVTPLVRVPNNEGGIIGKMLDAGAWGIICPMINTAAEARAFASACLYPPLGSRSFGPIRARAYGGATPYYAIANEQVLVLPQIETVDAVRNLEEILEVPGISGIYIGPNDLGLSMGLAPTLDREEPEIFSVYDTLLKATLKRRLIPCIHNATPAYAGKMIDFGFQLVTAATDLGCLVSTAREAVLATRRRAGVNGE